MDYKHFKVQEFKDSKKQHRVRVIANRGNLPDEIVHSSEEGRSSKSQMREISVKSAFAIIDYYYKNEKTLENNIKVFLREFLNDNGINPYNKDNNSI